MTDVKIRCDDCKFVENCVDYGWKDCKKFTPKQSEPMTNEEWFCGLSTEEKAECLTNISFNTGYDSYNIVLRKMVEWLKQPHAVKE